MILIIRIRIRIEECFFLVDMLVLSTLLCASEDRPFGQKPESM